MTETSAPDPAPQHEVPEGFVLHEHLLATIPAAAEIAGVSERTIRTWIAVGDNPLPCVRRANAAPLICVATMALWMTVENRRRPGIGEHGGRRRR